MSRKILSTKLGPLERSVGSGVVLFLLGCILALLGIFVPVLGLLILPGGWLVYNGNRVATDMHRVDCPFCGKPGSITANQKVYRCSCGRKSAKHEEYLMPILDQK